MTLLLNCPSLCCSICDSVFVSGSKSARTSLCLLFISVLSYEGGLLVVYICIAVWGRIACCLYLYCRMREDWDHIYWFNLATFCTSSKARIHIIIGIWRFFVFLFFALLVRGERLLLICWIVDNHCLNFLFLNTWIFDDCIYFSLKSDHFTDSLLMMWYSTEIFR